jgi:hypothetical protein
MHHYTRRAIAKANTDGVTKAALIELGLALHVGQDRGAHDEGLAGKGHSRQGWKPDDPSVNAAGHHVAKAHTAAILNAFHSGLGDTRRQELRSVVLGGLAGPAPGPVGAPLPGGSVVHEDARLRRKPPLFYMGLTKGMFPRRSGLPLRLGGVFTPVYSTGLAYLGGKGETVALDQQLGLRLLRITPRVYVDVLGGGVLGVDFNDRSVMAGVSAAVHLGYTGERRDYGLMLNKVWDLAGDRNLLVIGVGGTFEETGWLR